MTPTEPRLHAALDAATNQIRVTLTAVAGRVSDQLGAVAQTSGRITERDLLISSQFELRRNIGVLHRVFADELAERIGQELAPREEHKRTLAVADWQTLSLVDDNEMEERMYSDRIGQQISHACESELRELAAYMGSLLQIGRADQDRNPLRAEVLGAALYRAIEAVSNQPESRKLLARELGSAMAKAMPECYLQILRGLQNHGVKPVVLTVRQVEGPGNQLSGVNSAYATLSGTRSQSGDFDTLPSGAGADHGGYGQRPLRGSAAAALGGSAAYPPGGAATRFGPSSRSGLSASQADAQLMALLRHLTAVASRPGEFDAQTRGASASGRLSTGPAGAPEHLPAGASISGAGASAGGALPYTADGLTGLMAVNLIRAHREELMQASGGKLDHMVIDVVGSLFDQILSDSRVPPQMARQIARLQLPVLRVALTDQSFFSSRRHPVRRFVNRIASLACAFDDFDDGPGKHFLDRVRALVQEIVEGDFDQIEIYTSKLAALESFIADQTDDQARQQGAAGTLASKETELRLQQRYMLQLQSALAPLDLPPYLREFLPQVWSQAMVLAVSRDGPGSDRAKRYRRVGRDLVMSVQPKGSPALRKKFLMQLPPLMKDLNEGLALIGWPDAAQREFFAKLLPAHAESLKGQAQSELDHNMMVKQLEAIFGLPVPGSDALSAADPVPEVEPEVLARRFSAEEVQRVGLVTESAVDWAGTVDIDLGDEIAAGTDAGATPTGNGDTAAIALKGIDVDLSLSHADPAEPSRGPQLFDHIKLGFAYQMHMKDEWQKVRLSHVSAGRSFFVFTCGKKHQETISMTARMLARMCETGRMRAVESAYLMERATQRARKQLAALGTPTRS
ncbi:MAG: DUF1631 family protein [Burkholderiales bacterium]|nr:DUF1631 family protein [Burkholderiales bacterium]MDE2627386.1 DUF1631 family protein [Burkholderiales bacterium]